MLSSQFPDNLSTIKEAELIGIRMPNGFDPKDPERVARFHKRLIEIRNERIRSVKHNVTNMGQDALLLAAVPERTDYSQRALARELGCSEMTVSKYFHGQIKSIPMRYLSRLSSFFSASPHYLVGYVDHPDYCLALKDNDEIEYLPDGSPQLLIDPMSFWPSSAVAAANRYQILYQTNQSFYWLLDKLIQSPPSRQKKIQKILEILLNE